MALSAAIVWECRASGASDNSGGGFVAGATGTDFSQQNSAQVVINNSTITTSITANVITFTGATYTPTSADVGNIVQMLTGTNVTAGFYQITAQTATTWTVTGAVSLPTSGTTTNATGNMGGALATLAKLASAMVASNKAFSTGAFTSTATTTFAQSVSPTGASPQTTLIGYGAVRGDGTRATLTLGTNTGLTGINATGAGFNLQNIKVDCASLGTSTGVTLSGSSSVITNCLVTNFATKGINQVSNGGCLVANCEVTGGVAGATAAVSLGGTCMTGCFVHDNACIGVQTSNGSSTIIGCLVTNNSGASSDGLSVGFGCSVIFNTIHNNGRDGILMASATLTANRYQNNVITSNGRFGINFTAAVTGADALLDGNAYFNNTSGTRSNIDSTTGIFSVAPYTNVHDKILTGSPYVGPTTGSSANFGLNNTAGAGAACRAAGSPGTWPGNTGTTGFLDMGAVQHPDTGGSLLVNPDMCGGMHG